MFKPNKQISKKEYADKIKAAGDRNREFFSKQKKLDYEYQLSRIRYIDEDLIIGYLGRLKVQLIYKPFFSTKLIWDIRELNENLYGLFEAELENDFQIKPGYNRLNISSDYLKDSLISIYGFEVKLNFSPKIGGLDGTIYGLNIIKNDFFKVKINWWNGLEGELEPMDILVKKMIHDFRNISERENID